jgi:hypothetical protein
MPDKRLVYLQHKQKGVTEEDNRAIRACIEVGDRDVYELADRFGYVPVQFAGIKSAMTKGH